MSRALIYHTRGKASEVLRLENYPCPEPGPGQVHIALRAAVIHPSDLGMIAGTYGKLKDLPAVAGREAAGEVTALGPEVNPSWLGARVRMPAAPGAWAEAVTAPAADLTRLPDDLDWTLLAQAHVNPTTAWRLLHDFVPLQPGDWIVQNAANSAVGFCVAGLARHLGLHTLCIVRDPAWETPLKQAGATAIATENSDWFKDLPALTGGPRPRLALNSVGGLSALALARALAPGGTHVTFGGMSGDKIRFPTRELIFHDITLRGFWMDRWFREKSPAEATTMMTQVFDCLRQGIMQIPIEATYPFDQALEAITRAEQPHRQGKILITA